MSGDYLPFGISSPYSASAINNDTEILRRLEQNFPNTSERAVNSIMKSCVRFNWIDASGAVYREFVKKFEKNNWVSLKYVN